MSEQQREVSRDSYEEACVRSLRHTPVVRVSGDAQEPEPKQTAARGLTAMFGLDPRAAMLVTVVDLMLIAMDIVSGGVFILVGFLVAAYLGFLTYKIQRAWFRDDHESSLIKAMIVGLLMAIPVPLTPILALPCGIVGAVQMVRRPPHTR